MTLEPIKKLNSSNVVLVGHSAGGSSLLTALEHSQLVKSPHTGCSSVKGGAEEPSRGSPLLDVTSREHFPG